MIKGGRSKSRQRALQVLFQWDLRKQPIEDALDAFYTSLHAEEDQDPVSRMPRDAFLEELISCATKNLAELDRLIVENSQNWRLERMPAVDRNILRLAVCEMVHLGTPPAVAIDEAIELARRFSGDESVSFVNGVLDAVRRSGRVSNSAG